MPEILITDNQAFKVRTDRMNISVIPHQGYQEIREYRSGNWVELGTTPNPIHIAVVLP
jgi:hypothetical protein